MPLTVDDVHSKQFTIVRLREGYAVKEVDDFLDHVEAALSRLTRENESLRGDLVALQSAQRKAAQRRVQPPPAVAPDLAAGPSAAPPPPQSPRPPSPPRPEPETGGAARLLELAQRVADGATEAARREAEAVVGEARGRAEGIERAARSKAEALERDAQDRYRSAIGALESARSALQTRIDALHGFEQEYRTRLKSYVGLQLTLLEAPVDGPPVDRTPADLPAAARPTDPTAPPAPPARPDIAPPYRPAPAPLRVPVPLRIPVPAQIGGFFLDEDLG
ncbi:DivIVA domain-containing protein [Kitasatospora sp. NPDC057015]|uniref:DivIVA domain-containing protein n=1 Tax=Kitasatospora sp. NPDC057015 TaxID=3346001 RepID=UPI00363C7ADA